jgi:hypothetical protein
LREPAVKHPEKQRRSFRTVTSVSGFPQETPQKTPAYSTSYSYSPRLARILPHKNPPKFVFTCIPQGYGNYTPHKTTYSVAVKKKLSFFTSVRIFKMRSAGRRNLQNNWKGQVWGDRYRSEVLKAEPSGAEERLTGPVMVVEASEAYRKPFSEERGQAIPRESRRNSPKIRPAARLTRRKPSKARPPLAKPARTLSQRFSPQTANDGPSSLLRDAQ